MADTKLSALDALAALAGEDLFYVVDDPAGVPVGKSVTADMLRQFASNYSIVLDAAGGGDYTTLSDAVAALTEGDTLFIRNGTYAGGVMIATANVTILGESRSGVIIQSPATTTPCFTVTAAGVTLRNLKIDGGYDSGSGTPDASTWSGIYVTGDHFVADNVWVFETYGHGISAAGADYGRVAGCLIENRATNGVTPVAGGFQTAVRLSGSDRWYVAFNRITGWASAVALLAGSDECVVTMNKIVANYGYTDAGHTLTASACVDSGGTTINYRNIWMANTVAGSSKNCIECGEGVEASQFVSNQCSDPNTFADGDGYGIAVTTGDATAPTLNILLRNNRLAGAGVGGTATGVTIATRGAVVAVGNQIEDCDLGSAAVTISGIETICNFSENTFIGCDGGVSLSAEKSCIVAGNMFTAPGSTNPAIVVTASAADFPHIISSNHVNDIDSAGCVGIKIDSTANDHHRIINNMMVNLTAAGIDLNRGHCIVIGNYIESTTTTGALIISNAAAVGNLVHDNTIDNNDADAILLNTGVTHNVVTKNRLIGASATVNDSSGSATNQTEPNHSGTLSKREYLKALGAQTVGTTEVTVAHGLGYTPTEVKITMTSAGTVWKSSASDGTNIYLTADDAGRTAEVFVR